jgi:hypothetical protein
LLRLTDIRGLSVGQFEGENAEAPYIYLDIVRGLASYKLGCHPAHGPHLARTLSLFLGELSSIPEISEFQVSRLIYKDIVRFDISMHDVPLVKRLKAFQGLIQYVGADTLSDVPLSLFNNGGETATVHEFKEDPKSLPIVECIETSDYVVIVFAHLHDTKFVPDNTTFLAVLGLDELKRILLLIFLLLDKKYSSKTTITDLLDNLVELRGIVCFELR